MTNKMAIRYLSPVKSLMKKLDFDEHYIDALDFAIKVLKDRPQGKWLWFKDGYYKCDKCGEVERAKKNFCSKCGANMQIKDKLGGKK